MHYWPSAYDQKSLLKVLSLCYVIPTSCASLPANFADQTACIGRGQKGLGFRVGFRINPYTASLQGLELNVRAMAAAGADNLFTSQPAPKSRLQISRNEDGTLADPEELEAYIANMHAQGKHPVSYSVAHLFGLDVCRVQGLGRA